MFNLGERVKHIDTGNVGIVIGLGKRIVDNKCLSTVKVKIISPKSSKKTMVKDLNSKWLLCPEDYREIYPNILAHHQICKPMKRYDRTKTA